MCLEYSYFLIMVSFGFYCFGFYCCGKSDLINKGEILETVCFRLRLTVVFGLWTLSMDYVCFMKLVPTEHVSFMRLYVTVVSSGHMRS